MIILLSTVIVHVTICHYSLLRLGPPDFHPQTPNCPEETLTKEYAQSGYRETVEGLEVHFCYQLISGEICRPLVDCINLKNIIITYMVSMKVLMLMGLLLDQIYGNINEDIAVLVKIDGSKYWPLETSSNWLVFVY